MNNIDGIVMIVGLLCGIVGYFGSNTDLILLGILLVIGAKH